MYMTPPVSDDLIMATLNPTIIAYIADMVSKQVKQHDKDVKDTPWSLSYTLDGSIKFPIY